MSEGHGATLTAIAAGDGLWRVTIEGPDRVGTLAAVTGLLAARDLHILTGKARTVRPAGTPRVLDEFVVRTPTAAPPDGGWEGLAQEWAELVRLMDRGGYDAARHQLVQWLADRASGGPGADAAGTGGAVAANGDEEPLAPVEVEVDNEADPAHTVLRIHAQDTQGFLFEFASALAVLQVNVDEVQVHTEGGLVRDTFRVTDAQGRKLVRQAAVAELRYAAVLIKQFTHLLPHAPDPALALAQFGKLIQGMLLRPNWAAELHDLERSEVLAATAKLLGASSYLWEDFLRLQHENLFPVLCDVPGLEQDKSRDRLAIELSRELDEAADEVAEQAARLNRFKDREMFRIDLRHITERVDFRGFSEELSDLADVVVEGALGVAVQTLREATPCAWTLLALGKHGGRELGYASDIEPLMVYAGSQADDPAVGAWFEGLMQAFVRTLKTRREGTFEIDLRLRPHGRSGPLATTVDRFTRYFGAQGAAHQYERMALVRLRPVAGDPALARVVMEARDACVYHGPAIDLDEVRRLRRQQVAELAPGDAFNVKYGAGGLVDVEYFVQSLQIEAGRDLPRVRAWGTLAAIERLQSVDRLDGELAKELRDAWSLLRRLIDALRIVRGNARDLTLPEPEDPRFPYLARRLHSPSAGDLAKEIGRTRDWVRQLPSAPR